MNKRQIHQSYIEKKSLQDLKDVSKLFSKRWGDMHFLGVFLEVVSIHTRMNIIINEMQL